MSRRLLLVRHPPVARAWAGRCSGSSDIGWSREGAVLATRLTTALAAERPTAIVHSGLLRARRLADRIAGCCGVVTTADPRWRERDFGGWEGRRWDAIWRETGDLMDRLMTDPETFRPGGDGETGRMLHDRVLAAHAALPATGTILVVAHGGPIATLRAALAGAPLERAVDFIPACGEVIAL